MLISIFHAPIMKLKSSHSQVGPTEISGTNARKVVWDTKNPQITSADIQDSIKTIESAAVPRCTIKRHLKENGLHGRAGRRRPLLSVPQSSPLQSAKGHFEDEMCC